jgi:hypothetical protein
VSPLLVEPLVVAEGKGAVLPVAGAGCLVPGAEVRLWALVACQVRLDPYPANRLRFAHGNVFRFDEHAF